MGLSKILCKRVLGSGVGVTLNPDSVFKDSHKLIHHHTPVVDGGRLLLSISCKANQTDLRTALSVWNESFDFVYSDLPFRFSIMLVV